MHEINYFQMADTIVSYDVRATRAVKRQINERMQVKPGEHVLILADYATEKEMIEAFSSAVAEAGAIPTIMIMPNSGWDEWPLRLTPIAQNAILYGQADVVISCERTFLSWWGLEIPKDNPKRKPARNLAGSEQSWKYHGVFDIEKEEMQQYFDMAKKIAKVIDTGTKVRVTGKGGSDLSAEIYGGGFETHSYLQALKDPQKKVIWSWENVGVNGCEVDIAVAPGTAEGIVVWDGPVAHVRGHGEPITLTIEKGKIVNVDGSKDALIFKRLLNRIENMDQVVEVAAGLTPGWFPDGSLHAEKRGLGNTHVACGGWYPQVLPPDFVQPNPYMHVDGAIYCGALEIDGKKVIEEGNMLI